MDTAAFVTGPGTEKITIELWRAGIIFPLKTSHIYKTFDFVTGEDCGGYEWCLNRQWLWGDLFINHTTAIISNEQKKRIVKWYNREHRWNEENVNYRNIGLEKLLRQWKGHIVYKVELPSPNIFKMHFDLLLEDV